MKKSLKQMYDVAVVGGGPAGSAAAIRLANAGLSILLVEQKKFPREKLCGEFISPECFTHFAELGVMPEIAAASGSDITSTVFLSRGGGRVAVPSEWFGDPGSLALGLSRARMDELLLDRARQTGVEVLEETSCSGLLFDDNRIVGLKIRDLSGMETEVSARVTIDATGRIRALARRLEKQNIVKSPAKFVAFKTHLGGANLAPGTCEIYAYRGGYGGCSRVENDRYNLCFIASVEDTKRLGGNAERVMREVIFTNKHAAKAMRNAEVLKPWLAVPIEKFGRLPLVPADGLITIGDAATFIDPFTGSGILLALESSKIAAEAIIGSILDGCDFQKIKAKYERNYAEAFDRRLRVCSIIRYAAFVPFLAEATISALSLSSGVRRRIAEATRFSAGPDV